MRFCLSCGIAIAPDRLPDGFSPITIRATRKVPRRKDPSENCWMHIMTALPSQLPAPQEQLLLHELNHRIGNEFCCATPQIKLEDWTFALQLGVSLLGKWNWAEFEALPQTTIKRDIHCVTKWSKLDTTWQGVTFDDLLKAVGLKEPPAFYIMAHCDGGYTTNVPVAELIGG